VEIVKNVGENITTQHPKEEENIKESNIKRSVGCAWLVSYTWRPRLLNLLLLQKKKDKKGKEV
jgi:hypothetical protein